MGNHIIFLATEELFLPAEGNNRGSAEGFLGS